MAYATKPNPLQESEKSIDLFNLLIGLILGLEKTPRPTPRPIAKRKLKYP